MVADLLWNTTPLIWNCNADVWINDWIVLVYFLYFERITGDLWGHLADWLSIPLWFLWGGLCDHLGVCVFPRKVFIFCVVHVVSKQSRWLVLCRTCLCTFLLLLSVPSNLCMNKIGVWSSVTTVSRRIYHNQLFSSSFSLLPLVILSSLLFVAVDRLEADLNWNSGELLLGFASTGILDFRS